jgi:hypothetical protein
MPTRKEERELAALADGSLPEAKRAAAEQLAASSAEAEALLAEQRRALASVTSISVSAPSALRERIEADYRRAGGGWRKRNERRPRPARGRGSTGWAVGATAAAAIVILLLALPAGGPATPSAAAAAGVAVRPVTTLAPPTVPRSSLLRVRAAGVPYPDWSARYEWRAIGMRNDGLGDRTATTVFYQRGRQAIAYTIVSGTPLALPANAASQTHEATTLHLFEAGGRTVVTWTRLGHTCLLSGARIPASTLVDLAAWRSGGQIPF